MNLLQNRVKTSQDLFISEAENAIAIVVQYLGPGFVSLRSIVVNAAVQFDDEFTCRTIEVDNELPHGMLRPKLQSTQLPVP